MSAKVVFVTAANILDKMGSGGVKASLEHLKFVQQCVGKDNVQVCTYIKQSEIQECNDMKIFIKEESNLRLLFSALFGCKVYLPWREKDLVQYINACDPDLLFLDYSVLGRLIKLKHSYKTVVFFHNIEADYAWNKVKNEGIFYLPSYWASRYNDKWASKADKVICLNERDAVRLYECYGRKADLLIPITFEDLFEESCTTINYKREILFFGSLFPPNQFSIEWFIKNVMPKLKDIKLNIAGRDFEKKKEEYEQFPNVTVIGSVLNPADLYYRHSAVVLPIKYGAGMKVKTAEAMMYGRRIFAADEALEGYDIENIAGITRCNMAEEFADAINHYFDKEVQRSFEPEIRYRFLEKYETNCVVNKFNGFINNFLRE